MDILPICFINTLEVPFFQPVFPKLHFPVSQAYIPVCMPRTIFCYQEWLSLKSTVLLPLALNW